MVKVFYWHAIDCFAEAMAGYAIGIGDTKESVIEVIVSDALSWWGSYWSEARRDEWADLLRSELLLKEPEILDSFPVGIAIPGSA